MSCFSSHCEQLKEKSRRRQSKLLDNKSVSQSVFDRNRHNLDTHQLVWCDRQLDHGILEELRRIIDYTKVFVDSESCQDYLEQTQHIASFLVCGDTIGKQLIPAIQHLHNVRFIYIDSKNKEYHPAWLSQHAGHVYTNRQLLLQALVDDVKKYLEKEKEDLFHNFTKQDRSTESGSSSWWVTFMDVLCHLPYPKEACHQHLISELRNYYKDKAEELRVIDEFERDYRSDKAVWWYTRNTFFFRLINKANRQHSIPVMFAFGYYIQDLFMQLKKEHDTFKAMNMETRQLQVFRGQIMSEEEVETLKSAYMIRLTSFLSTSLDRRLALSFLPPASMVTHGCVRVLIEINLDAKCNSKPFGNISHLSEFSQENEVLLMIGTFLRVRKSTHIEEEQMIKLMLTLEDDYILPFDNNEISLKRCVSTMAEVVSKDATEEDINMIFDELDVLFITEKEWFKAERYRALAGCHQAYDREDHEKALTYYNQALSIWQKYSQESAFEQANLYLTMGRLYYYDLDQESVAQQYFESAIAISQTGLDYFQDNEQKKAILYKILSDVYLEKAEINNQKDEEEKLALHYEQLRLQSILTFCSPNDRELALCYMNIAELHETMNMFNEALEQYEEAAKIYTAKNDDEALSRIYQRMSRIYEDSLKNFSLALKYRLLKHGALIKSSEILPLHDDQEIEEKKHCVIQSHIQLADIHLKLCDFETARRRLMVAKQLYKEMNWINQAKSIEEKLTTIGLLEHEANLDLLKSIK